MDATTVAIANGNNNNNNISLNASGLFLFECQSTEENVCAPSPWLAAWNAWFTPVFGYLSAVICSVGMLANVANTLVLTRPQMRMPTNILLTGIAVADMLTMAVYLIYTIYLNIISANDQCENHTPNWVKFLIFHNAVVITCHTAATFLIVALGVVRCLTLYSCPCYTVHGSQPQQRRRITLQVTNTHACLIVLMVSVSSALFCLPNYVFYEIYQVGPTAYWFRIRPEVNQHLESYKFLIYGCVVKILASVLITILTSFLIAALRKAKRRRDRLKERRPFVRHGSTAGTAESNSITGVVLPRLAPGSGAVSRHSTDSQRTTVLLVLVVASFVLAELPQGVMNVLAALLDDCFLNAVYIPSGNLMDTLVVLSSCVNFLLYCFMSKQFRDTFKALFCPKKANPGGKDGRTTTPQHHAHSHTHT